MSHFTTLTGTYLWRGIPKQQQQCVCFNGASNNWGQLGLLGKKVKFVSKLGSRFFRAGSWDFFHLDQKQHCRFFFCHHGGRGLETYLLTKVCQTDCIVLFFFVGGREVCGCILRTEKALPLFCHGEKSLCTRWILKIWMSPTQWIQKCLHKGRMRSALSILENPTQEIRETDM